MTNLRSLHGLFHFKLQSLVGSEILISEQLPDYARICFSPELGDLLRERAAAAFHRISILEQILSHMLPQVLNETSTPSPALGGSTGTGSTGTGSTGVIDPAILTASHSILQEGLCLLMAEKEADPAVLDAGIAGVIYQVGMAMVAAYGGARTHAVLLKKSEVSVLSQIFKEEIRFEEELNRLIEDRLNPEAALASPDDALAISGQSLPLLER